VPKPEVEILALEAVSELRELQELDPEVKEPEVELETVLVVPLRDWLEPVAAIGAETLFACEESGKGKASVTDGLAPLEPTRLIGGVNDVGGASYDIGGAAGLNFAVAGEIRTEESDTLGEIWRFSS